MPTIKRARIGLLNAEQIRNRAVCEVTETSMMLRGHPKEQGVTDVRFGSTGRFQTCGTCLEPLAKCPGHTGFIDTLYPLPHIGLLQRLVKTLDVTCLVCAQLLLTKTVGGRPSTMLSRTHVEVTKLKRRVKVYVCPHCGAPQGRVYISEPFLKVEWQNDMARRLQQGQVDGWTVARWKTELKDSMTNWRASYLLRAMTPDTLRAMGVEDPDSTKVDGMLIRALLVPAIMTRMPPASDDGDGHAREQHALSKRLCAIVKQQRVLHQALATVKYDVITQPIHEGTALFNAIRMLYYHISNYMIPGKTKIPNLKMNPYAHQPNAKAISVIKDLEGGKKGRFRGNLMGKRVNFGARGVITSGADLDVDEIGVPERIAKYLTEPITITPHNRHLVQTLIERGEIGQLVDPDTGTIIHLVDRTATNTPLINGWVAERYLHDGTYVLMNRQPTLHLPSMMAHRVKVVQGDTFLLPPAVTAPYNADFDGDEMNMHVPQTIAARAELRELTHVAHNVLHPRSNKPCIGLIQDHLIAAYNLCFETRLPYHDVVALLSVVKYHPETPNVVPMGHSASLLPSIGAPHTLLARLGPLRSIYTGRDVVSCITPSCITFTKGSVRVERGILKDGLLSSATLGATPHGYVHHAALHGGGNVVIRMLSDMQRLFGEYMVRRYGFSFGPADIVTDARDDDAVQQVIAQAEAYTRQHEHNEGAKCNALRQVVTHVAEVVSNREGASTSAFQRMATHVKSKGSAFNAGQSMGCVGQTLVGGQRIGMSRKRVLPDTLDDLTQHGFVRRSFKRGLTPFEAFLNNAGGREGLIDTSVKTQTTGYFERCMMKFLENIRVELDGTVCDVESKEQVQPRFSGDGLDQRRLVCVTLPALLYTDEQLQHKEHIMVLRDRLRQHRITPFKPNLATNIDVYLPFDMAHLVATQRLMCACTHGDDPCDVVQDLCAALTDQPYLHFHIWSTTLDVTACLSCWHRACDHALQLYHQAHVTPGDAIGAIVGSSTGEPATQMALSAFHFAGTDLKGTQGVPRLKEIINATQHIATPISSFAVPTLKDGNHHASTLPQTFLRDVVDRAYVDTLPSYEDDDLARQHASILKFRPLRPYCMRFLLDKPTMLSRALHPHALVNTLLSSVCVKETFVCASLFESNAWEVRIYMYDDNNENEGEGGMVHVPLHHTKTTKAKARDAAEWLAMRRLQQELLNTVHVGGLQGVVKTAVRTMDVTVHMHQEERIMVDVQGASLMQLWCHLEGTVDTWEWYVSNDVLDIAATLGIDAASAVLYNELVKCNEAAGTRVDEHLAHLLVDAMTHYGCVMPISRHGMNRVEDKSILTKISFEKVVQGLLDAAPRGLVDPLTSVSARLMVGKDVPVGTQLHQDAKADATTTPICPTEFVAVTSFCDDEMPLDDVTRWIQEHGVALSSKDILPTDAAEAPKFHAVAYDAAPHRREFRVSSPEPRQAFFPSSPC